MFHLLIKLVILFVAIDQMLKGNIVEGMLFIVSGQLMDTQLKLNVLEEKLFPKKKQDANE